MQTKPEALTGPAPALVLVDAAQKTIGAKLEFHIDSEDAANWYLRHLANIEAEKQRILRQAAQIVKQLESDADGLRWQFEGELQEWTRQELAKRGNRRKSLTLLQGTAAFRSVPASLKISDPDAALRYAVSCLPDAVTARPTLDTEKYRAAAAAAAKAGQTLPGMESVPAREAFAVKFGKAE